MGDNGGYFELVPNTITLGSIITISNEQFKIDFNVDDSLASVLGFDKLNTRTHRLILVTRPHKGGRICPPPDNFQTDADIVDCNIPSCSSRQELFNGVQKLTIRSRD